MTFWGVCRGLKPVSSVKEALHMPTLMLMLPLPLTLIPISLSLSLSHRTMFVCRLPRVKKTCARHTCGSYLLSPNCLNCHL